MGEEYKYNWDDIDVGHLDLNHSENFFVKKHLKHEKFNQISPEKFLQAMNNKENNQRNANFNGVGKYLTFEDKLKKEKTVTDEAPAKTPFNLLTELPRNDVQKKNTAPSLCKYTEIYQRKKETMYRKLVEDEKKKREFVSKPAPNYAALHEQQARKMMQNNDLQKVTIPVTPLVLKKYKEADERRRLKIEEYKKRHEPVKFVSRDAQVLSQEPFIPKKAINNFKPNPFQLSVEKRLEERKQYDNKYKKKIEEKKIQEQHELKLREEKEIKELRKQITFKARPNPFK